MTKQGDMERVSLLCAEISDENEHSSSERREGDVEDKSPGIWRGWLVVVCSFLCVCVLDGVGYSFGVFFDPLLHDLGADQGRGLLSIAGSLQVYS